MKISKSMVIQSALTAGIMIMDSKLMGQDAHKMMPCSDEDTLIEFAKLIITAHNKKEKQ